MLFSGVIRFIVGASSTTMTVRFLISDELIFRLSDASVQFMLQLYWPDEIPVSVKFGLTPFSRSKIAIDMNDVKDEMSELLD